MATPKEMVSVVAAALGTSEKSVTTHDRNLAASGLRTVSGRGLSVATMTARDFAILIIAVAGSARVTRSAETVTRYHTATNGGVSLVEAIEDLIGQKHLSRTVRVEISKSETLAYITINGDRRVFKGANSRPVASFNVWSSFGHAAILQARACLRREASSPANLTSIQRFRTIEANGLFPPKRPFREIKAAPDDAHHLIKLVFEQMNAQKIGLKRMASLSGVRLVTLKAWRLQNNCPSLFAIEPVLQVLGLKLTASPIMAPTVRTEGTLATAISARISLLREQLEDLSRLSVSICEGAAS